MHIAFLTTEFPHQQTGAYGGIGTSIKNLAVGLKAAGHQVTVFVISQQKDEVLEIDGFTVYLIKQRKYAFISWFFYKKYIQQYINTLISLLEIDLIESPDWTGISAFMSFKCPTLIRFNGTDAYFCKLDGRKQNPKNFWLEKIALKNVDHLASVSQFTADQTKSIFNLKKEIRIIPNSVDVNLFQPQHDQEIEGQILYFGTLIRKKGVLELMEVFNQVIEQNSQVKLNLAGADVIDIKTGRSTRELMEEQLSLQAKKQVNFLGKLDYEQMNQEIAKATVITLPSYAEALPMTWIEAMAMEKALVTSDIGWAQEVMVHGTTGFTVAPGDHNVYANRILELLSNKELRRKMGTQARNRVKEKFSQQVVVQQNIDFYKRIIGL